MVSRFIISIVTFVLVANPWIGLNAFWIPTVPEQVSNPAVPVNLLEPAVLSVNPQGNAVSVWVDEFNPLFDRQTITSSFYTRGIGWSAPQIISSLDIYPNGNPYFNSQGDPDVALHSSNYAVAVWEGLFVSDIFDFPTVIISAVRNSAGVWQPIQFVSELNSDLFAYNAAVQINSAGTALAAWFSDDELGNNYTMVNFLPYGGVWGTPFALSGPQAAGGDEGHNFPRVAINSRGDAVVSWYRGFPDDSRGIDVSTYNAATATWSTPVTLDTYPNDDGLGLSAYNAIDENGNAVVVLRNLSDVKAYYYPFGGVWGPAVMLSTAAVSDGVTSPNPAVVMDPAGNATAVWVEDSWTVHSSYRPFGGAWGASQIISSGTGNIFDALDNQDPLSVDNVGNVLALWVKNGDEMLPFAAFRPFGQPWQPEEQVSTVDISYGNVGLASCGFAVALWSSDEREAVFAAINANLLKPVSASYANGCQLRFVSQSTYTSFLSWVPVSPSCIQTYRLYCNGFFIAESQSTTLFETVIPRCTRRDTCIYTITSVNIFGYESDPVPFVFNG